MYPIVFGILLASYLTKNKNKKLKVFQIHLADFELYICLYRPKRELL